MSASTPNRSAFGVLAAVGLFLLSAVSPASAQDVCAVPLDHTTPGRSTSQKPGLEAVIIDDSEFLDLVALGQAIAAWNACDQQDPDGADERPTLTTALGTPLDPAITIGSQYYVGSPDQSPCGSAFACGCFIPETEPVPGGGGANDRQVIGGTIIAVDIAWVADDNGNPIQDSQGVPVAVGCQDSDDQRFNLYLHELGHALNLGDLCEPGLTHAECQARYAQCSGRPMDNLNPTGERNQVDLLDCQKVADRHVPEPCPEMLGDCGRDDVWDPIDPCELNPSLPGCNTGGGGGDPVFPSCRIIEECVTTCGSWVDPNPSGGGGLCVDDPFSPLACEWVPLFLQTPPTRDRVIRGGICPPGTEEEESCRLVWECDPLGSVPGTTRNATIGYGPWATIVTPSEGETVSGEIPVGVGVAESSVGGSVLGFFVDHQRVHLTDAYSDAPVLGLCTEPAGQDPGCPFVGFGGMLDTRSLSDGTHRLQVMVQRDHGSAPYLGWEEVTIHVHNQGQPPVGDIYVAQGWGGHAVMAPGSVYSFGDRDLAALPVVAPFLICNLGQADLHLYNHGTMVQGDAFGRSPGSPASFVSPQRCSTLHVRFETDQVGDHNGTVSIQSSDPDESVYTFSITGRATTNDAFPPELDIYQPFGGSTIGGSIRVEGWAIDDSMLDEGNFAITIDGQPVTLSGFTYGVPWSGICDLHAHLDSPNCPDTGWRGDLDTSTLADGSHLLRVVVTDAAGRQVIRTRSFVSENVPVGQPPVGWVTSPSHNEVLSGIVTVHGWALATTPLTSESFTTRLDGRVVILGNLTYGTYRPGPCTVHGHIGSPDCPYIGWTAQANTTFATNGTHVLDVQVEDGNGNVTVFSRTFQIQN